MPLIGFSYRPTPANTMGYLASRGKCVRPYIQFYMWRYMVTFRPFWKHISKENSGSAGVSYCAIYEVLNRRFRFQWGTI